MANKAVSNTGPLLHLKEIEALNLLSIFDFVFIPNEVAEELKEKKFMIVRKIKVKSLDTKFKYLSNLLSIKFDIGLAEVEAIALAMQEKADYFLTDDLDVRSVANSYNIEVHGTIGTVLRAFREKIIDEKTTISNINRLYANSSLFLTKELISQVIGSIKQFRR